MSNNANSRRDDSVFGPLLWAVFLGVSWTWIIGMFLPVLLVRDHGLWGWVVFAIPNVVGAAAMGWVLRDADASRAFVRRHAGACYVFSLVTIAFHVYFAAWMIQRLHGLGLVALVAFVLIALLPGRNAVRWVLAVAALGISVGIAWMLYRQGMLSVPPMNAFHPPEKGGGVVWLVPAMVFGFGLCPYLDLTFHRARQQTSPAGGRAVFGLGFGVVFASMIAFTMLYARWLAPAVAGEPLGELSTLLLCVHLIVQSALTVAFHVRELPNKAAFVDPKAARAVGLLALFILFGAALIGFAASTHRDFIGHDFGEAVYWCFLGFYGLIFPGYLWIHGFPGRGAGTVPTQRTMIILFVAAAVAFPTYWLGFAEGRTPWLVVGLSIILAARALVRPTSVTTPDV